MTLVDTDLILALYQASHQLQLCTQAAEIVGNADAAHAARAAGNKVLKAIGSVVAKRAREQAAERTS